MRGWRHEALVRAEAQAHTVDAGLITDRPDGHLDACGEPVGQPPRVGAAAEHVDAVEALQRAVALAAERNRDAPRVGAQIGEVADARPADQRPRQLVAAERGIEHDVGAGQSQLLGECQRSALGDPRHGCARAGRQRAGRAGPRSASRWRRCGRSPRAGRASSEFRPRRSAQLGLSSSTRPSDARPKAGVDEGICIRTFARAGQSDSSAPKSTRASDG